MRRGIRSRDVIGTLAALAEGRVVVVDDHPSEDDLLDEVIRFGPRTGGGAGR